MAIGRPQMEEQIKGFAEAGAVDKTDPFSGPIDLSGIDPSALMMMANYQRAQTDAATAFPDNLKKYQERLAPYVYQAPQRDIFDLASTLGAGILSAQQKGVRNPYVGLGMGFSSFSQQLKKEEADNAKARQQMGLQAANLALQSEQKAKDCLNQMGLKLIDQANKKVDYIRIEYDETNEAGETEVKTASFPNTAAYRNEINDLMTKKNGREIRLADTQINMPDPNKGKADLIALESVDAAGKDYAAKAKASAAVIDQVNEAYLLAQRVIQAGGTFGPMSDLFLKPKEILSELGFGDLLDAEGAIAPQKALRQLSMGFTMAIVSQTKGAISNKEMQLFINASPTLGSTYEGYMMQLRLLERVASRDKDFYDAYLEKKSELIDQDVRGQKMEVELEKFANSWRSNNPLLTPEDEKILQEAADRAVKETQIEGENSTFVPSAFKKLFDDRKRELAGYPTVNSQADYDRLEEGDYFYEGGILYQK
jgi:hypothetical protein